MKCKRTSGLLALGCLLWLTPALGEAKSFHDASCTKDCSGHKAGYEWARKKGITSPEQCGGKSNSFTEGCKIWAKEHQAPSKDHSDDK